MWTLALTAAFTVARAAEPTGPEHVPLPHDHTHAPAHEHEHGDDATMHHRFDDPARWSAVFDDPARTDWQKPAALVSALGIAPGDTVADIGAGTGYFEPWLSVAVGAEGKVVAIDVEAALVQHIAERAAREGTPQVEARLGKLDDPGLRPREADLVLIVDTYHHIDDRVAYFTRLREGVAKRGRLVIVDFRADRDTPVGPPPEHRLPVGQVRDELAQAGWTVVSEPDLLPHQYVLILR